MGWPDAGAWAWHDPRMRLLAWWLGVAVALAGARAGETNRPWAFTPVVRPAVPAVPGARPGNPIDAFVEARLAKAGIQPNPRASRRVLLRRATLGMVGLPPTFEEAEAMERESQVQQ